MFLHNEVDTVVRVLSTTFRSARLTTIIASRGFALEICTRRECNGGRIDEIKRHSRRGKEGGKRAVATVRASEKGRQGKDEG